MKTNLFLPLLLLVAACGEHAPAAPAKRTVAEKPPVESSAVEKHYAKYAGITGESRSIGKVNGGKLENGYILPFSGKNFQYFDTNSYLQNRGFVNGKVLNTLVETYRRLETVTPQRTYGIMECSKQHGGRIYPHITHQNGLSVDFMTPLLKDGKPFTELDAIGPPHYLMDFDKDGCYKEDKSVRIDFETMAKHLLVLIEEAEKQGLNVEKIIWKMELRDELFATGAGKKLRATGVYVTTKLGPLVNALHDDHYHVDFSLK